MSKTLAISLILGATVGRTFTGSMSTALSRLNVFDKILEQTGARQRALSEKIKTPPPILDSSARLKAEKEHDVFTDKIEKTRERLKASQARLDALKEREANALKPLAVKEDAAQDRVNKAQERYDLLTRRKGIGQDVAKSDWNAALREQEKAAAALTDIQRKKSETAQLYEQKTILAAAAVNKLAKEEKNGTEKAFQLWEAREKARAELNAQIPAYEKAIKEHEDYIAKIKKEQAAQEALSNNTRVLRTRFGDLTNFVKSSIRTGTIITGTLFALTRNASNLGDALAKTSARLGITGGALQELRYAGGLAGLSVEDVDNNLSQLSKRLGDAMNGTGEAGKMAQRYGLSLANLAVMSSDERLGALADTMQHITNDSERAAFATAFFGKSGMKMINMLKDGSAGLAKAREEARKYEYVFSKQDLAGAETFNDSLHRLMTSLGAFKNALGAKLFAPFSKAMDALSNIFAENRASITDALSQMATAFLNVLPVIVSIVGGFVKMLGVLFSIPGAAETVTLIIASIGAAFAGIKIYGFATALFAVITALKAAFLTIGISVGSALWPLLALAGVAFLVFKYWEPIKKFFTKFGAIIWTAIAEPVGEIKKVFGELWDSISDSYSTLWSELKTAWAEITGMFSNGENDFDFFKLLAGYAKFLAFELSIVAKVIGVVFKLIALNVRITTSLIGGIVSVIKSVIGFFAELSDAISARLAPVREWLENVFGSTFVSVLSDAWDLFFGNIFAKFKLVGKVVSWLGEKLGILDDTGAAGAATAANETSKYATSQGAIDQRNKDAADRRAQILNPPALTNNNSARTTTITNAPSITINAQPGQDPDAIARAALRQLSRQQYAVAGGGLRDW